MNIKGTISEKIEILNQIQKSDYCRILEESGKVIVGVLKNGGKVLCAGNGGSACDAQHFVGEMIGRFMFERKAIPAISLCVDPAVNTCVANDYGYEEVFSRQIEGLGKKGDVFIAISTSGNSKNLIKAINVAKEKKMIVIGLLGKDGGKMKELCDFALVVPSESTPRIQEIHTFSVHMLCEYIEKELFS